MRLKIKQPDNLFYLSPAVSVDWICKTSGLASGGAQRHVDGREPIVTIFLRAAQNREELILQRFGDRAARSLAHLDPVNGSQRADFRSGSGEENFVGNVKHFAGNQLLANRNFLLFAQCDD